MKKRLIIPVRGVETLNQPSIAIRSKSASFPLTSTHVSCDFDLRLAIHLHDSTHAGQTPGNLACNVSHKSQPRPWENESPRTLKNHPLAGFFPTIAVYWA